MEILYNMNCLRYTIVQTFNFMQMMYLHSNIIKQGLRTVKGKLVGDNVPVIITMMHFILMRRLNIIISENFKQFLYLMFKFNIETFTYLNGRCEMEKNTYHHCNNRDITKILKPEDFL